MARHHLFSCCGSEIAWLQWPVAWQYYVFQPCVFDRAEFSAPTFSFAPYFGVWKIIIIVVEIVCMILNQPAQLLLLPLLCYWFLRRSCSVYKPFILLHLVSVLMHVLCTLCVCCCLLLARCCFLWCCVWYFLMFVLQELVFASQEVAQFAKLNICCIYKYNKVNFGS